MPDFIDWTVSVSDILILGGGLVAFVKMFLSLRDSLRDISRAIGQKEPPDGLIGDVQGLKRESRQHRDRLIEMGAELGIKNSYRT